jgi:prepilin-type N-terminal cleavage/methylation domain-containing protein
VKFARRKSGFTLIELLVVISILGLLAGLAVPALKNLGKSNITVSASRQLLDDLARARQMAISQRTTVYMVFMPTNFWLPNWTSSPIWVNTTALTPAQRMMVTNLCDKQFTGYTFLAHGSAGDQPGQHLWRYLTSWQNLPDGSFIAMWKFSTPSTSFYNVTNPITSQIFNVAGFTTNSFPFPTATNSLINLPFVAFNYLGQLTFDGQTVATRDEYIPLAQGSVTPSINPATKTFVLTGIPQVTENPPGNSTGLGYNIIDIDPLTGRAVLRYHKMAP